MKNRWKGMEEKKERKREKKRRHKAKRGSAADCASHTRKTLELE